MFAHVMMDSLEMVKTAQKVSSKKKKSNQSNKVSRDFYSEFLLADFLA